MREVKSPGSALHGAAKFPARGPFLDGPRPRWWNARGVPGTSWRTGFGAGWILLGIFLLPQLGCLNPCQQLCNSWYGFRKDVCDDPVEAADLNRCLTDHRTLLAGAEEDEVCAFYLEYVDQLGSEDQAICGERAPMDGALQFDLGDAPEEE